MDIMLVMEVLQRNPYKNGSGVYAAVAAELRKSDQFRDVQPRALQERTKRLLKAFRSSQMQSLKRSGSEEEYDERERLLQDLSDLEKEWTGTHKRATTPPPNASEVRKKAAKLHAMGKAMQDKLGAPMRPSSSTAAEPQLNNDGAQVQVVQLEEEPGEDNRDQGDLAHADEQHLKKPTQPQPKKAVGPAARWSSTMDYMCEKLEKEEESKKQRFDIQREELQLKKEELEVRKLEATNEHLRIEAQQRENQHRADMEERRRQEEREERNLMMDRQNKLMDAMLQLIHSKKD